MNSILENLNSEQLQAVTYQEGSSLVLAGAGSGKTRVLTARMAWLIQTGRCDVHSIVAVTFTNKAAREMGERLQAMTGILPRTMWLGTFHGLCHRFLRKHYQEAQLDPAFNIMDSSDQLSRIKRMLKAAHETNIDPKVLQGYINTYKENGFRAHALEAGKLADLTMLPYFQQYDELCRKEHNVDFAELMLRTFETLQAHPDLLSYYQNRFTHILVDEFQDTSQFQYQWLCTLAGEHTHIFAVGDDDQSIYSFRGAQGSHNMKALMRDFKINQPIVLEENYRSTDTILQAANALIAHNKERLGKNLRTRLGKGEQIRFVYAHNDLQEADLIADAVQHQYKESLRYSQIALLYRNNAQSRMLEQALSRRSIPYRIYGGLRFYERQEIKHALAYLRLALNHHDDEAFLRIVNMPPRAIGAKSLEQIRNQAYADRSSLLEAARKSSVGKISAFAALIDHLHEKLPTLSLYEAVRLMLEQSNLCHYFEQKEPERFDNLQELLNAAALFEFQSKESEALPLHDFLANAALEAGERQAGVGDDAVQLMTVHASKGLEFDVVFLSGLEEGLFPSQHAIVAGMEEERRLMYVAITRAKKQLYICAAKQRFVNGQQISSPLSRFVERELPQELIYCIFEQPRRWGKGSSVRNPASDVRSETCGGFQVGDNVRHKTFGLGVVIGAQKSGLTGRLTINFGKNGVKTLDAALAPLERC